MRDTLDTDFFTPRRPRVIAHRGDSGAYPENTMESFRAAAAAGALYIELDVHLTRDGEVVVIHDADLERTSGRKGSVARLTYVEIAAVDAGFTFCSGDGAHPFRGKGIHVPRLEEVLNGLPDRLFVIEVKQVEPSLVEPLIRILDRAGMRRRVAVVSEHQRPLDEIRRLAPGIPANFSRGEVQGLLQAIARRDAAYRPPGDALQVPPKYESWHLVTPEIVAACHRMGVEVHVWTVNETVEMRELIAMGVDGIITDFPGRLLELGLPSQ
jgi:glycerophosphoryl diester phosphodiesterase